MGRCNSAPQLMLSTLFDIGSPSTWLAEIGAWSLPIFDELKPLLYMGVAIILLLWLVRAILGAGKG